MREWLLFQGRDDDFTLKVREAILVLVSCIG